jgi:hypothetical protein
MLPTMVIFKGGGPRAYAKGKRRWSDKAVNIKWGVNKDIYTSVLADSGFSLIK